MPRQKIDINNKVHRVVPLTCLISDIVNYLSNDSKVAITRSSLSKEKNEFANKNIISSCRVTPDLKK